MTDDLPHTEIELEVPFYDVDSMQIVWHGRYAQYFEIARCQLLADMKFGYPEMAAAGYSWPVIDLHTRFIQPLRFRQKILVEVKITEFENRLVMKYLIRDQKTGRRATRGQTTQVAVEIDSGELLFASPPVLEEHIRAWQS